MSLKYNTPSRHFIIRMTNKNLYKETGSLRKQTAREQILCSIEESREYNIVEIRDEMLTLENGKCASPCDSTKNMQNRRVI